MKFYRFELGFNEEPQGVGFLQGIDEIGLPIEQERGLLALFRDLPCPRIKEKCEFWFTEYGLLQYADALNAVDHSIRDYGWYLVGKIMEENDLTTTLYYDLWQAAWSPKDRKTDHSSFVRIDDIGGIAIGQQ